MLYRYFIVLSCVLCKFLPVLDKKNKKQTIILSQFERMPNLTNALNASEQRKLPEIQN